MNKYLLLATFISFLSLGSVGAAQDEKKGQFKQFLQEQGDSLVDEVNKLKDKLELRGGISLVHRRVNASFFTQDDIKALGFQTAIAIRASPRYELNVSSYVHFGKSDELEFEFAGMHLFGDGRHETVAISPQLKIIPGLAIQTKWYPYFFAGPSWSLQAQKLKPFVDLAGTNRVEHKITFESVGAIFGLGFEEKLPAGENHPLFFEFLYSYMRAYKIKLVDASDFIEVNTITAKDKQSPINGAIFMFNFGMTFL